MTKLQNGTLSYRVLSSREVDDRPHLNGFDLINDFGIPIVVMLGLFCLFITGIICYSYKRERNGRIQQELNTTNNTQEESLYVIKSEKEKERENAYEVPNSRRNRYEEINISPELPSRSKGREIKYSPGIKGEDGKLMPLPQILHPSHSRSRSKKMIKREKENPYGALPSNIPVMMIEECEEKETQYKMYPDI